MQNNWYSKAYRTLTCLFPVSRDRKGECVNCGECCKLPNACPFLRGKKGKTYCSIYKIRPVNCRKYPRTEKEHITQAKCGFKFR